MNRRPASRRSVALISCLLILSLLTIIVVCSLVRLNFEQNSAERYYSKERSRALAALALHGALYQIRCGLGPWDNPFTNFNPNPPAFYWSISPGLLTRWDYATTAALTNIALFSQSATTNLVNLNPRLADGTYPIAGPDAGSPDISVRWVNVLADPSAASSSSNQVIGRYAFWVDDECAKINLNTADGTQKGTTNSPGVGTPGEVSLQALSQGGTALSSNLAAAIVKASAAGTLNAPRDLLSVSNAAPDLYSSNNFSVTAYNGAPELNVFGWPRVCLAPVGGYGGAFVQATVPPPVYTNAITGKPLVELYPTWQQLPAYKFKDPATTSNYPSCAWPQIFTQLAGNEALAYGGLSPGGRRVQYLHITTTNSPLATSFMLAYYLAGTNGFGKAVQWPAFPGASGKGPMEKYSLRQLDSIVAQISDLPEKLTSPAAYGPGTGVVDRNNHPGPAFTPGWLSGQMVSGMGRTPKLDGVLFRLDAFGPVGTNTFATAQVAIYLDWVMPAHFRGASLGTKVDAFEVGNTLRVGASDNVDQGGLLNGQDASWYTTSTTNVGTYTPQASPLAAGGSPAATSYWQDTLLTNDAGIDFQGNSAATNDPDARSAALHPYALGKGAGPGPVAGYPAESALTMGRMCGDNQDWLPGEFRCYPSLVAGANASYSTITNATSITIGGGLALYTDNRPHGTGTPFEVVPLDSARGLNVSYSSEAYSDSAREPGSPSMTLRALLQQSVIPVRISALAVPPANSLAANTAWSLAQVADPLVNQFPGDWVVTTSQGSAPATAMNYAGTTPRAFITNYDASANPGTYSRSINRTPGTALGGVTVDPDSYWAPDLTTNIQASARFPSTGYLQYVRTGVIPDDEIGVPYASRHGTPFRLLNFAPSADASQALPAAHAPLGKSYPDWAMLDLFMIPSASPRQPTRGGATPGRINPNGAVLYTTNTAQPLPGVVRLLPLEALFRGIQVNQTLAAGTNSVWSGGAPVDEVATAKAVAAYIAANGPLRMPGEIANVPDVAAKASPLNPTRNDLVRQVVGNLTTQSNVFSVWVAAQAVQKIPSNTQYDRWETGDVVLGETRTHYIVERYLDPGADGVHGNAAQPGPDGMVGTYDDPVDPVNHPASPRYLYRVIYSEEIKL